MRNRTVLTMVAVGTGLLWACADWALDQMPMDARISVEALQTGALPVAREADFLNQYVRTKKCMRSAGTAANARGDDAVQTMYVMASVCGNPMLELLARSMDEALARDYVLRITRTSYYEDVLHTQEPPINAK